MEKTKPNDLTRDQYDLRIAKDVFAIEDAIKEIDKQFKAVVKQHKTDRKKLLSKIAKLKEAYQSETIQMDWVEEVEHGNILPFDFMEDDDNEKDGE